MVSPYVVIGASGTRSRPADHAGACDIRYLHGLLRVAAFRVPDVGDIGPRHTGAFLGAARAWSARPKASGVSRSKQPRLNVCGEIASDLVRYLRDGERCETSCRRGETEPGEGFGKVLLV